jgi:hypothetical protein
MITFEDKIKKFRKKLHTLKFSYLLKMINTKHVIYWGNYMYYNNKLQKISFINSFVWKNE